MQQVELTSQLLKEFSIAYATIPNVFIEGGEGVPFNLLVLSAWFSDLHKTGSSIFFGLFQAYLCGRDLFVLPELSTKEFLKLLATTVQEGLGQNYDS